MISNQRFLQLFQALPLIYQFLLHTHLFSQALNYIIPPFIATLLKVSSNSIPFPLFPHPLQSAY